MSALTKSLTGRRRTWVLTACGALFAALLMVAAFAPLPFAVAHPGPTANVLGDSDGKPVITITGAPVREPEGELRMTTITATAPDASVRLTDVLGGYFASDEAVLPTEAVYPVGDSVKEIQQHNREQMTQSQHSAVAAALGHLGRTDEGIDVALSLDSVGGPSAGLLFSLGIVDLLDGDGHGGDLTGGAVIAGTGTIDADGTVGPVGGVPLKTQAAKRDGATVFLVPRDECDAATANLPDGLRLIPVTTLSGAIDDLRALAAGESVPGC